MQHAALTASVLFLVLWIAFSVGIATLWERGKDW
jgi:hypothetical protein